MKQSIKSRLKRAAMYLLGFSATPMLTACYGLGYYDEDIDPSPFEDIYGVVYGSDTDAPIPGIKVSIPTFGISTTTDKDGKYLFKQGFETSLRVHFEDIDGAENGSYRNNSTIVTSTDHINTNITLQKVD